MNTDIRAVMDNMRSLQAQLEEGFEEALERFSCTLEDGRIRIADEVRDIQRRYRKGFLRYLLDSSLANVLVAPVIYGMIVPLVLLDAALTIYQHICFRAYGVPRVRRLDYLVNDRHRLDYLNVIEKLNCAYCGYANGLASYAREILSRTEQYWCPIRHAHRVPGAHDRYPAFIPYGDAEGYRRGLHAMRDELSAEGDAPTGRRA